MTGGLPRWLRCSLLAMGVLVVAGGIAWFEIVRHHHHWGHTELWSGRYAGSWRVAASDRDKLARAGFPHEHLRIELDQRSPAMPEPERADALGPYVDSRLPTGVVTWDGASCPMRVEALPAFSPSLWVNCLPPEGRQPFGGGPGSDGFAMELLVTRGALDGDAGEDWLFLRFDRRGLASGESLERACIRFVRD
ncbi:MAG TPA: hypothetical protein VK824_12970 [Planctomycetota bacterium]|nr:hypothetical protein [Planctomycetota bacterium]